MRKGVLTKTSIKVLLSLLLLIGSFEPVVSASYGGSKPADVTFAEADKRKAQQRHIVPFPG